MTPVHRRSLRSAAPAVAAIPPVVAADPADDVTNDDRPVRIDVGRFEPRAVTPGATVTVTGTLTNTGSAPISDLAVRLQRGKVLTTREELAAGARSAQTTLALEDRAPTAAAPVLALISRLPLLFDE